MIQRFPTRRPNVFQRAASWLWMVYNRHHWLAFAAAVVVVSLINLLRNQ